MVTHGVSHKREWSTIWGEMCKRGRKKLQMKKRWLEGTSGNFLKKGDYHRYVYTLSLVLKKMIKCTMRVQYGIYFLLQEGILVWNVILK